jgi:predicted P-loop ATPase
MKAVIEFMLDKNVRMNSFTNRLENQDGSLFEDVHLNTILIELKERGIHVTKDLVRSVIGSDRIPKYNPLLDWLKTSPSTGSELQKLFESFKLKEDNDQLKGLITKWLMQLVATVVDGAVARLVLILIGESYVGKTEFFRRLLPKPASDYYSESGLNRGKDTEFLLAEYLLVNVDELAGIMSHPSAVERFKSIVGADYFTSRRAYGTYHSRTKRRAVICGTSNTKDVILDHNADNTRLIPVELLSIDHDLYNEVDKNALFGELFAMYRSPKDIVLNQEELRYLAELSEDHKVTDLAHDIVLKYLEPYDGFVSGTDAFITITKLSGVRISRRDMTRAMDQIGLVRTRKLVHGRKIRGYKARFRPSIGPEKWSLDQLLRE